MSPQHGRAAVRALSDWLLWQPDNRRRSGLPALPVSWNGFQQPVSSCLLVVFDAFIFLSIKLTSVFPVGPTCVFPDGVPRRFSSTCYADSDGQPTCDSCPPGYSGRRCERYVRHNRCSTSSSFLVRRPPWIFWPPPPCVCGYEAVTRQRG